MGLAAAATGFGVSSAANLAETTKTYAEDVIIKQKTACRACPRDCGVIASIQNGRIIKIQGNPEDNFSGGRMCPKGLSGVNAVYHPNRTKYPMKRIGERGVDNTWERISWDEAIDMVAKALAHMRDTTGRNGLLCTAGGGGNPKFFDPLAFRAYWGGGNHFEPGAAQCRMPRSFVQKRMGPQAGAIGDGGGTGVFDPNFVAECVVQWGAGACSSSPAQMGRNFVLMRERGTGFINVDPRFTPDSARADIWLPIRPGTDCAMMLAWAKYIVDNKKYNEEFLAKWTNLPFLVDPDDPSGLLLRGSKVKSMELPKGEAYVYWDTKTNKVTRAFALGPDNEADYNPDLWGEHEVDLADGRTVMCKTAGKVFVESLEDWTLEKAAEICWSPLDKVKAAVEMYANAKSGGVSSGVSLDQYIQSTENAQILQILNILKGNANQPGSPATGDGPRATNKYAKGGEKGLYSSVNRSGRFAFNPNLDKDGNRKPHTYMDKPQVLERLGYIEHKGLGYWQTSQIPAVHAAAKTGDPYPIKVWMDRCTNKMAMIADSSSWLDAIPNIDFISHATLYPTSFSFEAADVLFPITEWLESAYEADAHGGFDGYKVNCVNLFEHCDDRFIYGTIFKKLADDYNDENAYNVFYVDNEYYTIDTFDEYLADMAIEGMTWEETKEIGCWQNQTAEEYWDALTFDPHLKVGDDGLYAGFVSRSNDRYGEPFNNIYDPMSSRDIKDEARKTQLYHDYLLTYGRYGDDPFGELPPASQDYLPLPVYIEPIESPLDPEVKARYPLVCTNGRTPFYHHGTLRNIAFLREIYPAPELWIDPQTAAERGIKSGDWVNIKSQRCNENEAIKDGIYTVANVTKGIAPGVVYMERWWNPEFLEEGQDGRKSWTTSNINVLTRREGPHNIACGTYTLRGIAVEVTKASKPDGVWYDPEDFEPWLPQPSESTGGGYGV
jgi:anaerobic selenocysteine-containing dehydrogenase